MKEMMMKFIAKNKFRFNRGYSYFVMFGIPFLVADALQQRLIPYGINLRIYYLVILAAVVLWITGYLEDKFGIMSAESEYSFNRNPAWTRRNDAN
jgi:hypothetical protein